VLTQLSLLVVGVGSLLFHMTLRYDMQLLDEIPMMFSASIHTYALLQASSQLRAYEGAHDDRGKFNENGKEFVVSMMMQGQLE
jgi:hypothetical protein